VPLAGCEREHWAAGVLESRTTLVTVPELDGTFIEVETIVGDGDDIGTALRAVWSVLLELGIRDDDVTTEQYTDAVMTRRSII